MVLDKTEACIFCKIANKEIETEVLYENEHVLAFHDLHPQAPVHILIIPKQHIPYVGQIPPENRDLLGHMNEAATILAKNTGIDEDGYRLVINSGDNGGQTVFHLHMHLIGGRIMKWPPG